MTAWLARMMRVVVAVCAFGALGGVTPGAGALPAGTVPSVPTVPSSSAPLPAVASWIAESNQAGALLGWAALTAGDVNGDGFSDVVVGAPNYDSATQPDVGKVFVYHGSASGLGATPAWTMEGVQAGEQLGYSAGTAGDVNGDGFDDLIVGAVNHTGDQANEGIVYVFLGSASGLAAFPAWSAEGNQPFSAFGHSVATAGDVNSDGFDDVVIGAPFWDGALEVDEGRALVYLGGQSGLQPIPAWTYQSHQSDARLGASVAGAGDVNGDGFADVIVGAYQYTGVQSQEGRAFLFYGNSGALSGAPDWTSDGGQFLAWYGVRVATAGDTNGDGYSDLIVGTWSSENDQTQEGRAYVYLGSASGPAAAPVWIGEGNEALSRFGSWIGTAGDLNGDGYADIVVGSWLGGAADEGRAFAYLGSSAGPVTTPAWTATGYQASGQFGLVVGTAGDVNGDGFSDVIVGAAAQDAPQIDEGRAYVYHGRAEMPATTEAWGIEGNQESLGLGEDAAFADVNGDGYDDLIVGIPFFNTASVTAAGRAELYLGSATGLAATPAWSIEGTTYRMLLGRSVAGADLNGDGYADIAVGAIGFENGEFDEGQVRAYFGSAAGPGLLPSWVVEGNLENMRMGKVAAAGDVNGDGFGDLLVGSSGYENGQVREGQAAVYLGSATGPGPSPAWSVEANQADAFLGLAVASAGDVNGDGYSDVIVSAQGFDNPDGQEGKVWVYHGSQGGLPPLPAWTAEGGQAQAFFGVSVATVGDVNGDGYSDVLIGAYGWSNGQSREGAAFLYLGSSVGLGATPAWTYEGAQVEAYLGWSVAGAGDLNADGYSDVVVGAQGFDDDQFDEGRAFAFLGSAAGLGTTPAWAIDGNQDSAYFGTMVGGAGDVNADGFPEILVGAYGYTNGEFEEGRFSLFPGSGGYGRPRLQGQARIFGSPIAPLGKSDHAYAARLHMLGRTAEGRGRVKMEWEIAPLGVLLDGSGAAREQYYLQTGVPGANGSTWPFETAVGLFPPDWPHHWRVRTLGKSPLFPRSPWITPAFNGVQEADFRTPPPCQDFDGDGWGNPGQVDCPMGPATDCHDGNAAIHPGAPELCDGIDNDCNAAVDDVPPPGPVNTLTLDPPSASEVHFAWMPLPGPHVYDIVRGDLGTLRSSGGNYAVATTACVISGFVYGGYISWNSGGPPVGSGDWFMIRATCGGVHGTYNGYSPGQAGLRDAAVAASGLDCP